MSPMRRCPHALAVALAGLPLAAVAGGAVYALYGPYAAGPYGLGVVSPPARSVSAGFAAQQLRSGSAAWSWRLRPLRPAAAGGPAAGAVVADGRFDWDGDGAVDTALERIDGGWRVRRLEQPADRRADLPHARVEHYRDAAALVAARPAAVLAGPPGVDGGSAWVFFNAAADLVRVEYLVSDRVVERVWFGPAGAPVCREVPAGRPAPASAWPDAAAGAPADWRRVPVYPGEVLAAADAC